MIRIDIIINKNLLAHSKQSSRSFRPPYHSHYCGKQRHALLETFCELGYQLDTLWVEMQTIELVISFAYRFHYRWKLLARIQYFKGHYNTSRSFERLLRYYGTVNFRGLIRCRPLPLSLFLFLSLSLTHSIYLSPFISISLFLSLLLCYCTSTDGEKEL